MKKIILFYILFLPMVFAEDYDIYGNNETAKPTSISSNSSRNDLSQSKKENKTFSDSQDFTKPLKYPYIRGQILTEYRYSNLTKTGDGYKFKDDSNSNSYLYTDVEVGLNFNELFFAYTEWSFQPVGSYLKQSNKYADLIDVGNEYESDFFGQQNYISRKRLHLNDYGLSVNALSMNFRNNNLAFGVGKFEASFAKGYDNTRFTGTDGLIIPDEYNLKNKIGGYLAALLPFGKIQFNLFYNDETGLSNTMFERTGADKNKQSQGYNNRLDNFSVTIDGKINNMTLNLGYSYLKPEKRTNFVSQRGYALSLEYLLDYNNGVNIIPFGEIVYFSDYKGISNRYAFYTTESIGLYFENWRFLLSNNFKYDNELKSSTFLNQILVGYKFDIGIMFDVGRIWSRFYYKTSDNSNFKTKREYWTFMLSYLWEF
jgi:hypothetical protein